MLKPSQRANAPRTGGRGTGVIRLFKVLAVQPNGLVVEFKDQRGTERGFMEATPQFVDQKNKSPNFMAKAEGSTMHAKFYAALMRPTSNAEHQYRTNADILSAKVYPRNGSQTVEGFGELQKVAVGGGFTVFARAESQKKDPFDDAKPPVTTPGDETVTGFARIIHDKEAVNRLDPSKKGSSWMEFVEPKGSPEDLNAFFDHLREVAQSKRGPSVFIRILKESGESDLQTTVYPKKPLDEVDEEIASIRDLGLPLDRIVSWEVHPRVYLRQEFMEASAQGAPSKLERLRRDIAYTYGVKLDETPVEADAIDRGGRRVGGESYAIPMAVSLTMYNKTDEQTHTEEWVPGALRSVVPLAGDLVHSRQLFLTPEQRERAALSAGAAPEQAAPEAPEAAQPEQRTSAPAGGEIDFGAGDMDFPNS